MIKRKFILICLVVTGVLLALMLVPIIHGSSSVPGYNESGDPVTGRVENWYSIASLLTAVPTYGAVVFIAAIVIFAIAILLFIISLIKGVVTLIKIGIFLFVLVVLVFIGCTILSIANMPLF